MSDTQNDMCPMHKEYPANGCHACRLLVQQQIIGATPLVSAKALAMADILQRIVDKLHANHNPSDLGWDVERIGIIMQEKI